MRYAFTSVTWPDLTVLEVPFYITSKYGRIIEHGNAKNGSVDARQSRGSPTDGEFSEAQRTR